MVIKNTVELVRWLSAQTGKPVVIEYGAMLPGVEERDDKVVIHCPSRDYEVGALAVVVAMAVGARPVINLDGLRVFLPDCDTMGADERR